MEHAEESKDNTDEEDNLDEAITEPDADDVHVGLELGRSGPLASGDTSCPTLACKVVSTFV